MGSKKLRIFAVEKWGKKCIDNIRPPKAAVSGASSAPLFSGRRPRGLRYETPSLSGWWSAQPKGVWGWNPPSGGVGAKPLRPERPTRIPECLPPVEIRIELTRDDDHYVHRQRCTRIGGVGGHPPGPPICRDDTCNLTAQGGARRRSATDGSEAQGVRGGCSPPPPERGPGGKPNQA